MAFPANLELHTLLLRPAELPGVGRFWVVYEALDTGPVVHVRRRGQLPARPGETAEEALDRAAALVGCR